MCVAVESPVSIIIKHSASEFAQRYFHFVLIYEESLEAPNISNRLSVTGSHKLHLTLVLSLLTQEFHSFLEIFRLSRMT